MPRKPSPKPKQKAKPRTKAASEGIAPTVTVNEEPAKQFHGNTTVYTRELADEICERIACGETLRQVCRLKGIGDSTVRRWVLNDIDGFSARYAQARELCLESWADEVVEISENASNDWMVREGKAGEDLGWTANGDHISRSRLRVDSRKWLLSKLKPERYGDSLKLAGDKENPIHLQHNVIDRPEKETREEWIARRSRELGGLPTLGAAARTAD